jgi:ubiquinone/menaquinone biosynthesis C-methylase UbiE
MLRDDSGNGGGRPGTPRNVLGDRLEVCSINPMTGFFRDGCCDTERADIGSHTVCGHRLRGLALVAWLVVSRRRSLPCPVWLRWLVELDNPFTKTNRARVIIEHLGVAPGMYVLDIGCGPGRLTIPLATAVGENGCVVAIDVQAGMLKRARKKAEDAKLTNIRFVHAAIGQGVLERDVADRAVLVTVLGEIPDREAALTEIFGGLKPGGILSVTEVVFDPHFQRQAMVRQLANAVGFRQKALFGNRLAYTMHLEKSYGDDESESFSGAEGIRPGLSREGS